MANPEVAYEHVGTASPTTLAAPIDESALSFTVVDGTGYPTGAGGSFFMSLDRGAIQYEKILCSGRVGNVFTVATDGRGVDGTVAQSHALGALVEHTWSAVEATQLSQHISKKKDVHGVSSDIVGKDDIQTITGKTLVTPTIASFVNAGHDHSNAAAGGTIPYANISGLAGVIAGLEAEDDLKQNLAEKGLANGYPNLDALGKVPFGQLPVGTGGSEVAVGNHDHTHTHSLQAATRTNPLTERTFADGDPAKTLASLVVPAGEYLLIGMCKGLTAAASDNTGFQYDLATTAGTLWATAVAHRKQSTGLGEGCSISGYLNAPAGATVTFTGEKLGNGALLTNSTVGSLIAIPLSAAPKD